MCKRIILFVLVIMMLLSQTALAKKYEYRKTYIGETDLHYCYMYDDDVFLSLTLLLFQKQAVGQPKLSVNQSQRLLGKTTLLH